MTNLKFSIEDFVAWCSRSDVPFDSDCYSSDRVLAEWGDDFLAHCEGIKREANLVFLETPGDALNWLKDNFGENHEFICQAFDFNDASWGDTSEFYDVSMGYQTECEDGTFYWLFVCLCAKNGVPFIEGLSLSKHKNN